MPADAPRDTDAEMGLPGTGPSSLVVGSADARGVGETLPDSPPLGGSGFHSAKGKVRLGDRLFAGISVGAGLFIVALVVLVAVFLLWEAIPSIAHDKSNFLTSRAWSLSGTGESFGIAGLLWTTVLISVFALVVAVPLSIGIALFITEYAPTRVARPVAYIVDLLAAIPSIIYGIWGIAVLAPKLTPVQHGLSSALGWIPLFKNRDVSIGTVFDGGVVLAIMILPIITSISREVFQRTPRANVEAALALGATRWEMIRMSVLPFGRPGVVSGAMLGLGRALGETLAVTIIVHAAGTGAPFDASLFGRGQTFAARIATGGDSLFAHPGPFIAAGLVLFILTFIVNSAARAVVARAGAPRTSRSDKRAARRNDQSPTPSPATPAASDAPVTSLSPIPTTSTSPPAWRPANLVLRQLKNNAASALVTLCFLIALVPLVWLLWTVISRGWRVLTASGWWTADQRQTQDWRVAGGGALHAIVGTVEQVALCSLISVPIGVLAAVYLVEYGRGRLRSAVTFMVDILTGVPSIVAALFIYTLFIIKFGATFAGVWAALALVLLMIPVIVRTTEEMLKLVPNELREASYALGVPKWKTVVRIVLPTAFSGILTGIVLGIARVAGETAPLLILVHYSATRNSNLLSGDQASLPSLIYAQFPNSNNAGSSKNPFTGAVEHTSNYASGRMWGAALTLILLVMLLNLIARLIARRSKVSS